MKIKLIILLLFLTSNLIAQTINKDTRNSGGGQEFAADSFMGGVDDPPPVEWGTGGDYNPRTPYQAGAGQGRGLQISDSLLNECPLVDNFSDQEQQVLHGVNSIMAHIAQLEGSPQCALPDQNGEQSRQRYLNAFRRSRGLNAQGSPIGVGGVETTCSNYEIIYETQYENFLDVIARRDFSIRPTIAEQDGMFGGCMRLYDADEATRCASAVFTSSIHLKRDECNVSALVESRNANEADLNQALSYVETALTRLTSPECIRSLDDPATGRAILSDSLSLASSFAFSSMAGPVGLGANLFSGVFNNLIDMIKGPSLSDRIEDILDDDNTDKFLCVMRKLEEQTFDCDFHRDQETIRSLSQSYCAAHRSIIDDANSEQFTGFLDAINGISNKIQENRGGEEGPRQLDFNSYNEIAGFLDNSDDNVLDYMQGISTAPSVDSLFPNPGENSTYISRRASRDQFNLIVLPAYSRVLSAINDVRQGNIPSNNDNLLQGISDAINDFNNSLDRYNNPISGSGSNPDRLPISSFSDVSQVLLNADNSQNSSNSNALAAFEARRRDASAFISTINSKETSVDTNVDNFRSRLSALLGSDNFRDRINDRLENLHQVASSSGAFNTSSSDQSARRLAWSSYIQPLMLACSYAQGSAQLASTNSSRNYSITAPNSGFARDFQRTGRNGRCGEFLCGDGSGLNMFNPESAENASECSNANSVDCQSNYHEFICLQNEENRERQLFQEIEERYLSTGRICAN